MSLLAQTAGRRLELFGPDHLAALLVIAAAAVVLALLSRRSIARRAVCWSLCAGLIGFEAGGWIRDVAVGTWTVQDSLPLHLCDLAIFACVAALAGAARRKSAGPSRLYELAYFWALGGTMQALFTPNIQDVFPSPAYILFFGSHGAVVAAVVVMTFGLGMRPGRGAILRVWLTTNGVAAVVMLVNWVVGANYMFLCDPPKRASLFSLFGTWPWSLLTLEIVGTVILVLLFLPFRLGSRRGADAPGDARPIG